MWHLLGYRPLNVTILVRSINQRVWSPDQRPHELLWMLRFDEKKVYIIHIVNTKSIKKKFKQSGISFLLEWKPNPAVIIVIYQAIYFLIHNIAFQNFICSLYSFIIFFIWGKTFEEEIFVKLGNNCEIQFAFFLI